MALLSLYRSLHYSLNQSPSLGVMELLPPPVLSEPPLCVLSPVRVLPCEPPLSVPLPSEVSPPSSAALAHAGIVLFVGRAADIIKNWIRTRYTIEFLGTWEMIHNPNFKVVEFDHFRMQAGLPNFVMSVSEWIEKTNAIGIIVKKGRYGGTYAFKDIAFEFGTAISVTFKLYLIDEFQRLKEEEQKQLGWTAKRELSKINYRIHTDAIKSHLIPEEVTPAQASIIYAEEADVLNVAMFGMTAKQWREANPELKGNIRDYATFHDFPRNAFIYGANCVNLPKSFCYVSIIS